MATKRVRKPTDGDTWSIIVIDPETGQIGIAGASCTRDCSEIAGLLPGIGAIVVQARSNDDARDRGLELMASGAAPDKIMAAIREPRFNPERQQYGIVTRQHPEAAINFTGELARLHKGALTAHGIAVQGNMLANNQVVKTVMAAALEAQRKQQAVEEILMQALEAGALEGGDTRCGEQKARSAFIMVAGPDDLPGQPTLYLKVTGQKEGGKNAVSMLRLKYDRGRSKSYRDSGL